MARAGANRMPCRAHERVSRSGGVELHAGKVGAKLCVFAQVSLADHSEEAVAGFARIVRSHPEILECHAISGTADCR